MSRRRIAGGAPGTGPEPVARPVPNWRERIDTVSPVVLIIGGFLMAPPFYVPMRRRLLRRGAAAVVVDRTWTLDWILAGLLGLDVVVRRAERSLRIAMARSERSAMSGGAPVLVIGHSSGGIVARVLAADAPQAGRRSGHAHEIGALVTIGTPHHAHRAGRFGRTMVARAAHLVNRVAPGGVRSPEVGIVTVGSRAIVGRPDGDGRERIARVLYRAFLPDLTGPRIEGDGMVSLASALLEDTTQVVLNGVVHGQGGGEPWYGADPAIDHWWPVAVDAWRSALRARAGLIAEPARGPATGPVAALVDPAGGRVP